MVERTMMTSLLVHAHALQGEEVEQTCADRSGEISQRDLHTSVSADVHRT